MKKLLNYLCALSFLILFSGFISAQDFTVKIGATDAYSGYFKPVKAGASFQFQIEVKNNRPDTMKVSIIKSAMGTLESWVAIDNNEQDIFPSQSKNFLLTVTVPSSAGEYDYTLFLNFNAYDRNGDNHSFEYNSQIIIVDNSAPNAPTFSVSSTSTTLYVSSWDSWDARSSTYTLYNQSAGIGGIKSYKVTIKNPDGSERVSISKDATDYNYHTFTNLSPNTNYKANVTATDMAGNTKSAEKAATTAPAAPTGLTFSNTTYAGTTLSWTASAGATGYNVYIKNGSTNTKLNNSTITGTSYTIENLEAATIYKFNVIALSNVGSSDRSADATVATLALPTIFGSSTLCSGIHTYTISGLVTGHSVSWSKSSNLKLMSQSGASASFMVVGNGSGWVDAEVTTPTGKVFDLAKKSIWIGKPDVPTTIPSGYPTFEMQRGAMQRFSLGTHKGAAGSSANCWVSGNSVDVLIYYSNGGGILVEAIQNGLTNFYVTTSNSCGTSGAGGGLIKVSRDGGGGLPIPLRISPNPGNTYVDLDYTPDEKNAKSKEKKEETVYEVSIYSSTELIYHKKTTETRLNINTSALKRGFYYVNIRNGDDIVRKQFYISHD